MLQRHRGELLTSRLGRWMDTGPKVRYGEETRRQFEMLNQNEDAESRATAWLAKGNVKATRQRVALARILVGDGQDRHVSAEDLREAAKAAGETVSVATVYNTLHLFARVGLMREIRLDADRVYFDTRVDNHVHFYWCNTGELEDAPGRPLPLDGLPKPPPGARVEGVDVVIRLQVDDQKQSSALTS